MSSNRSGFTLVEMLIAIVMLGIGLLAVAAGSGTVTRTLHGSKIATQASQLAGWRMGQLRAYARSTLPPCTHGKFIPSASAQVMSNVSQRWTILQVGTLRQVNVISTYAVGRGQTRSDTLSSTINCN
jgi:prepilin-type N-terminal cleavage/methylation domain-containing protein